MDAITWFFAACSVLLIVALQLILRQWGRTIDAWGETLAELERLEMENDEQAAELKAKAT